MRLAAVVALALLRPAVAAAEPEATRAPSTIRVLAQAVKGPVNPRVFGQNLLGYDPMTYEHWADEYRGFSDFGEGVWDPARGQPVAQAMELLKDAGTTVVRFPGGCGTHRYDWHAAVGPDRKAFRFGIDEFLRVAHALGAEPVITLSYFTGDERTDADLIEYLNAELGRNPTGGTDWAAARAAHGHPQPYGVRYVEVGNEVWHGDHHDVRAVDAEDYARRYLRYYEALKAVDPSLNIGVVLHDDDWNRAVMRIIGDRLDFGVLHFYFSAGRAHDDLAGQDIGRVFAATLEEPSQYKPRLLRALAAMRDAAGREIPIAFTEYNTAFHQNAPVPYRHSLGAALVNAEILRVLMDPDCRILMANYWDFNSRFWGLVNTFRPVEPRTLDAPYVKRPNYYVYELYHRHFGTRLLEVAQEPNSPLSVNASASADGATVYLMVINRRMDAPTPARVDIEDFAPAVLGNAWVLDGPSVDAVNETESERVGVLHRRFVIEDGGFEFRFEPHSLTAIELSSR